MQSTGLWSLSHDLTTSLGLTYVPNLPKIHPHLHRRNTVSVHPYAHPQHIYQGAKTLCIHMIWMWDESLQGFEASTMTLQHHSD